MGRMVGVNVSVQKMGRRGVCGIEARTETLALGMFSQTGLHGDFLKLKETRALFRCEQHFSSAIIDRSPAVKMTTKPCTILFPEPASA